MQPFGISLSQNFVSVRAQRAADTSARGIHQGFEDRTGSERTSESERSEPSHPAPGHPPLQTGIQSSQSTLDFKVVKSGPFGIGCR